MRKRIRATGAVLVLVIVLSGVTMSSASAIPPLACYKAQNDKFGVSGNYKNATCTEKTAVLKGEYVLAEPLVLIKEDLWCAKMTPVVGPPGTGQYKNATCTEAQENGEFTEVIIPEEKRSSLPDISITLGGAYPIHIIRTLLSTKTALETTSGSKITAEGILELFLIPELTSLGKFELLMSRFDFEETKCESTGDKAGEVLTKGTFHVVLLTNGLAKQLGDLLEFEEVKIDCGEVKIKVKGSLLSPQQQEGTEATEFNTVLFKLEGNGAGKQKQTKYLNDTGTESAALLLSNFGSGFLESNEVLTGPTEITLLTVENKMFVITVR